MLNDLNFLPAITEIFLASGILSILLISLFFHEDEKPISYLLSILTIVICMFMIIQEFDNKEILYTFNKTFISDSISKLLKFCSCLAMIITLIYSRSYISIRGMVSGTLSGEFYVLALMTLLGQMIIISGNNFLIIYLGIELMSLSLYALVALRKNHIASTEAAMKYFVLGALASGFMLYGMSMLYGVTGSLNLLEISNFLSNSDLNDPILIFGIIFLVSGIAFKLGVAPFHMWVPDVYQGSPTSVTLLIGAAPKFASFAICMRLLVDGLEGAAIDWQKMLLVMSVTSMLIGNVTAIVQTNIKRLLAYSTIAQMGFMLLGLVSGVYEGSNLDSAVNAYSSSMFYVITYVLSTLGCFGLIILLSKNGFESDEISDFKGLSKRNPWFAFVMLIQLLSLAGIPPLVGFYAKLSVLQAALTAGYTFLVIFAVIMSLVGAYYYLRVIKIMYFEDPIKNNPVTAKVDVKFFLSINGISIAVLGVIPGPLMMVCFNSVLNSISS